MKKSTSSLIGSFKKIGLWVHSIMSRFPKTFDIRFYQRSYACLSALDPLFLQSCPLLHFKRLLITQFFLEKRIEKTKEYSFCTRLFSHQSYLYLSIISPENQTLTADFLFQILRFLIPSLKRKEVTYEWTSQNPSYHFLHLTFEKMRGSYFTSVEVKKLEKQFIQTLKNRSRDSKLETFWPYNHEEGYKQLLLLRKEIQSKDDLPHVWIQFHNRTDDEINFMIYLLKPDANQQLEAIREKLPHPFRLYFNQKMEGKLPVHAMIFSLTIVNKWAFFSEDVHLLNAREQIVQKLSHSLGPFRDFNGGLFETQKKQFSKFIKVFSHKIVNFSLFLERLFYAIYPIEKRLSLSDKRFKELFHLFSDHLETNRAISQTKYLLILSLNTPDEASHLLSKYHSLEQEGKVTAYAHVTICSKDYFCLLDEKGELSTLFKPSFLQAQPSSHTSILRLAFKGGFPPSFSPYHLMQDTRGGTLGALLFEGFFRLDSQGQIAYSGVKKMKISKDQRCYLFKMRLNHWSNGKVVTAFQYENAWKTYRENRQTPFFDHLTIRALDADSLQVDLTDPDPFFLEKLTHPIFSALSYQEEPSHFNGPYLIKEAKKSELILEKNPFYWDFKSLFFDEVRIQFELCSKTTLSLFKKGKIDWIGDPLSFHPPNTESFKTRTLPWNRQFFIHFNTNNYFLSSTPIRKAFHSVIDRKWISQNIFKDSIPMVSFFDQNPALIADVEKGRRWFLEGLRELNLLGKPFPPLTFVHAEGEELENLASYLKKIWEEAFGISIHLENCPWNTLFQKLDQGAFHIAGLFRGLYFRDPLSFFKTFSGKYRNFSHWFHPCYDQSLMEAIQTTGTEKRSLLLQDLDRILLEEMPAFPLFNASYRHQASPLLKNYAVTLLGGIDFRFAYLKKLPLFNDLYRFMSAKKERVIKPSVSFAHADSIEPALRKKFLFFSPKMKQVSRSYQKLS